MVASNDVQGRAAEVRSLIADDRLSDAMQRLMDFVRDFSDSRDDLTDVVLVSRSIKTLSKKERDGELEFAVIERERNQRLRQALAMVDEIELRPKLPMAS